jgi:hypothetical protein
MAAQFVDALKGYEYFLAMRGKPSRSEINDHLEMIGRKHISRRTFEHYQSLLEHGFRSYVPINKFDVFQALGKLQMAADRRRYNRESTDIDASVSIDGNKWIPVKVIDRSLVGFGMITAHRLPFKPGRRIWLQIKQYRDIPVVLVWKHRADNFTRFGVRAFEFIANYIISEEETIFARPTGLLVVTKKSEDGITWRELYRIMGKIDELIDSSAALLYSLGEIVKREVLIAPAIISSIQFGSPGGVKIKVDLDVVNITKVVIEKVQYWGLEKKKFKEEIRKQEIDNNRREIETTNFKTDALRNVIKLRKEAIESGIPKQVADSLLPWAMKALNIEQLPSPVFEPGSLEYGILKERLLPAAAELVAGDDPDIEVEVKEDSSDEPEEK